MFDKIGSKVKVLAKVILGIGLFVSIIAGFLMMATAESGFDGMVNGQRLVGLAVLLGGVAASICLSLLVYGFGELIERTTELAERFRVAEEAPVSQVDEVPPSRAI